MAKSHGLILDALDTLSRPGNAVKDILNGNGTGALHQIGQIPLDLIDSILPTSWQPDDLVTKDDEISGRDLIGAPDTWWGHALGFATDVALDPMTWLPASWVAKGLGAVGEGASALAKAGVNAADRAAPSLGIAQKAADATDYLGGKIDQAGKFIRDVTGTQKWDEPETAAALDRARNSSAIPGQAALKASGEALSGLDERSRKIITDAIKNQRPDESGNIVGKLVEDTPDISTGVNNADLRSRVAAHPDVLPGEVDDLTSRAQQITQINRNMLTGVPGVWDPNDLANLPKEYMMNLYDGLEQDPLAELQGRTTTGGKPSPMRERTGATPADVLEKNPEATYERDAGVLQGVRSQSQTDMARRAMAMQAVVDYMRRTGNVPDDVLLNELKKVASGEVKPPVPPAATEGADVASMLGGSKPSGIDEANAAFSPGSGTSRPPRTAADGTVVDPTYGTTIGEDTGKASAQADMASMMAGKSASVPLMITKRMEKELKGLGYPQEAINKMEPSLANDILENGRQFKDIPVPPSGTPSNVDLAGSDLAANGIDKANEILGEQTGKSVVGKSTEQATASLSDFSPEQHAKALENILGKDYYLSNPEDVNTVKQAIGIMAKAGSPETAKMALDALQGFGGRNAFWKVLADSNSWFKRFASYGILLPKIGKIVRNRLNESMQEFTNPATRDQTLKRLASLPSDLTGAVADALGYKGVDAASGTIEAWEDALRRSAGDPATALATFAKTHPTEAAFIQHGGLDGMVRGDDLVRELASDGGWMDRLRKAGDLPGVINRGVEDRMRLGLGKAQIEKYVAEGMPLDEAAKKAVKDTGDALYRYAANSKNNQRLKDLVPYASWFTQATNAELKAMLANPAYASIVHHSMERDPHSDPLYPYLDDQVTFDLGKDSTGNRQVVNGFGFPFETLAEIPNPLAPLHEFGKQLEHDVVGNANPLIKTAYGVVSGRDPNFSTPFNTFDKIPFVSDHAGEAGRLYQLAKSSGLAAPVDAPLTLLDQATDERRSLPTRLLSMLTGANVVTVDPLRAKAQQLQEELDRNPDVSSIAHLTSKDQDAEALIKELQDVQAKMKKRRRSSP